MKYCRKNNRLRKLDQDRRSALFIHYMHCNTDTLYYVPTLSYNNVSNG